MHQAKDQDERRNTRRSRRLQAHQVALSLAAITGVATGVLAYWFISHPACDLCDAARITPGHERAFATIGIGGLVFFALVALAIFLRSTNDDS